MGKSIVGVDIGSESLRAVELETNRKGTPTVVKYHELSLPDGAVKNGEVTEVNTVATVLKQLWSSGGFRSKRVVLGMGNPKVLVRDLTVPKLGRSEIRAALPLHVQDMLPVPVADALLDFYPVSESISDNGPVVNGLLVAAVKEAVLANVKAVQLAGLDPIEVDLISFALNRVLIRGPHAVGTVALVDVGASTTNIVITCNGVPNFARIIPAGGLDVTKALVNRLGISADQAELGKRQLGLRAGMIAPEHREAAEIIVELSNELMNSIRNTLSFFVNSRKGQHIDRIVVSGGGAMMRNFCDALAELTRIPVVQIAPFEEIALSKNAAKSNGRARPEVMTVALGLALGSVA